RGHTILQGDGSSDVCSSDLQVPPIIVTATMQVASAILSVAALGFLGLGAQPPTPEWGAMLNEGKRFMRNAPHLITIPGLAIMLVVLSLNFIGDALRDALDPRLRGIEGQ
ncbi:TPA: hypothetical protein DCL37_08655, partial [Candidatus Acetothermia bacterium]|nr:hypothetical protein [Candidatus Acetothermia bacterium]